MATFSRYLSVYSGVQMGVPQDLASWTGECE